MVKIISVFSCPFVWWVAINNNTVWWQLQFIIRFVLEYYAVHFLTCLATLLIAQFGNLLLFLF